MTELDTIHSLLQPLRDLHKAIRDSVVESCEKQSIDQSAAVYADDEGDTLYEIDRVSEDMLIEFVSREIASKVPVVLVAEGLTGGKRILPEGTEESECRWLIIVDPIDGTRGLMYQKRPAWILSGVAPNKGSATSLADIELAVQTEIPLIKQHLCDQLWAFKGEGAHAVRHNRLNGEEKDIQPKPSGSATIEHGFAMISRFFPGARDVLAEIDEELVLRVLGPVQEGKAHCFEDQYICSGGQLYELINGHDRFIADLRPLMKTVMNERGRSPGICCHPYDLCSALIAQEAGVEISGLDGGMLNAPLDTLSDVGWVGYANAQLRGLLEPNLLAILKEKKLL